MCRSYHGKSDDEVGDAESAGNGCGAVGEPVGAEKYERHTDDEIYDVKYHSVRKGILNSIAAYLSANIENY